MRGRRGWVIASMVSAAPGTVLAADWAGNLGCWALYMSEALSAAAGYFECVDDRPLWDVIGRQLCSLEYYADAYGAAGQLLSCLLGF